MRNLFSASVFSSLLLFTGQGANAGWQQIELPNLFMQPCKDKSCGNNGTHVYSMQFPSDPIKWTPPETDCPTKNALGKAIYRGTSTKWRSDFLPKVKGLSFKGLIYKSKLGAKENEFAVFFHEDKCYNGGGEYGWVFHEHEKQGRFYLCGNCNSKDKGPIKRPQQTWYTWPGTLHSISGSCDRMLDALNNPATYRYWNVSLIPNGNFKLQFVDPVKWSHLDCIIQKPKDFPNLNGKDGYVTISAQKRADATLRPPPYMHIDEVKVWR